jgi:membrane protein YqaA with SNARE-associated domain
LILVAFLDSSFLSLPEICDILVVGMVIQHPSLWLYYAACATIGSLSGSYVLYALARKGGEGFLKRRFKERHISRGLDAFKRYGLLAVIIPSMLPPPMPFKLFVLLAGVSGVRPVTFAIALVIGRGLRFGLIALVALHYGLAAMQYLKDNAGIVSLWLAIAIVVLAFGIWLWRRGRRPAA